MFCTTQLKGIHIADVYDRGLIEKNPNCGDGVRFFRGFFFFDSQKLLESQFNMFLNETVLLHLRVSGRDFGALSVDFSGGSLPVCIQALLIGSQSFIVLQSGQDAHVPILQLGGDGVDIHNEDVYSYLNLIGG